MKIQIKNRFTDSVIFETDAETIGAAVAAAILAKVSLSSANLRYANLSSADLSSADLRYANLSYANLSYADLSSADLRYADLSYANLSSADLRYADLSYADLRSANLSYANLRYANLSYANLSSANLSSEELMKLVSVRTILPDGDLIVWKKLKCGTICKLQIPAKAARLGGLTGRKCRAEFAVVLEGEGVAKHDNATKYKVGETVKPDSYDPNPLIECSNGIHFFITRAEADEYT